MTIDRAVEILNQALNLDPVGVNLLMKQRIFVNSDLADHPTIQVRQSNPGEPCQLRVIGILNGIFGECDRVIVEQYAGTTEKPGPIVGYSTMEKSDVQSTSTERSEHANRGK